MRRTLARFLACAVLFSIPAAVADDKDKNRKEWEKDRREALRERAKDRREFNRERSKAWREHLKEQRNAEKEWSKATRRERDDFEQYRARRLSILPPDYR
jgi:hypothetical protein